MDGVLRVHVGAVGMSLRQRLLGLLGMVMKVMQLMGMGCARVRMPTSHLHRGIDELLRDLLEVRMHVVMELLLGQEVLLLLERHQVLLVLEVELVLVGHALVMMHRVCVMRA